MQSVFRSMTTALVRTRSLGSFPVTDPKRSLEVVKRFLFEFKGVNIARPTKIGLTRAEFITYQHEKSIMTFDYWIREKLPGTRYFMWLATNGDFYLISEALNVIEVKQGASTACNRLTLDPRYRKSSKRRMNQWNPEEGDEAGELPPRGNTVLEVLRKPGSKENVYILLDVHRYGGNDMKLQCSMTNRLLAVKKIFDIYKKHIESVVDFKLEPVQWYRKAEVEKLLTDKDEDLIFQPDTAGYYLEWNRVQTTTVFVSPARPSPAGNTIHDIFAIAKIKMQDTRADAKLGEMETKKVQIPVACCAIANMPVLDRSTLVKLCYELRKGYRYIKTWRGDADDVMKVVNLHANIRTMITKQRIIQICTRKEEDVNEDEVVVINDERKEED